MAETTKNGTVRLVLAVLAALAAWGLGGRVVLPAPTEVIRTEVVKGDQGLTTRVAVLETRFETVTDRLTLLDKKLEVMDDKLDLIRDRLPVKP